MGFWGASIGGKGLGTAETRSWASYDNPHCEVSTGNRDLGEFSSTKADTLTSSKEQVVGAASL